MVEAFELKLATIESMKNIFDLSNDELVRQSSFNQEEINWEKHQNWFKNKISDKNSLFYIVQNIENIFMGYIRLDKESNKWIVTIHLKEEFRYKGFGVQILKKICILNADKCIIAFVKEKNRPSYNSFIKAGFKKIELCMINNEKYYRLKYKNIG